MSLVNNCTNNDSTQKCLTLRKSYVHGSFKCAYFCCKKYEKLIKDQQCWQVPRTQPMHKMSMVGRGPLAHNTFFLWQHEVGSVKDMVWCVGSERMLGNMPHCAPPNGGEGGRVDLFGIWTPVKQCFSCFRFRMCFIILFEEGKMLTDILGNKQRQIHASGL